MDRPGFGGGSRRHDRGLREWKGPGTPQRDSSQSPPRQRRRLEDGSALRMTNQDAVLCMGLVTACVLMTMEHRNTFMRSLLALTHAYARDSTEDLHSLDDARDSTEDIHSLAVNVPSRFLRPRRHSLAHQHLMLMGLPPLSDQRTYPNRVFENLYSGSDIAFWNALRMKKITFDKAAEAIFSSPIWKSNSRLSLRGDNIDQRTLLAAAFYELMHGTTQCETEELFGISNSYMSEVFPVVFDAIFQGLQATNEARIKMPRSSEELEESGLAWARGRHDGDDRYQFLRKCVGCGDCTLIPIILLDKDVPFVPARWRCREGFTGNYCV